MKKNKITKVNNEFNIDDTAMNNQFAIIDDISNGVNKVDVDINNQLVVDIINEKTSGTGTMIKPFYILSDKAYDSGLPYTGMYYCGLSDSIMKMNNIIGDVVVSDYLKYPILKAIKTTISLIQNEFESISDNTIEAIKEFGYDCTERIIQDFHSMIDIPTIFKYLIDKIGYEYLNDLYKGSFTDPDQNSKFMNLVMIYADPFVLAFANTATARLADYIFDGLYSTLLGELDSTDFEIVCEYIKPAILLFRDDTINITHRLIFVLIKHRSMQNPMQIAEDAKVLTEK